MRLLTSVATTMTLCVGGPSSCVSYGAPLRTSINHLNRVVTSRLHPCSDLTRSLSDQYTDGDSTQPYMKLGWVDNIWRQCTCIEHVTTCECTLSIGAFSATQSVTMALYTAVNYTHR